MASWPTRDLDFEFDYKKIFWLKMHLSNDEYELVDLLNQGLNFELRLWDEYELVDL